MEEEQKLKALSISVIKVPKCEKIYDAINGHPDIQINILDSNTIIVQRDVPLAFLKQLDLLGIKYMLSSKSLTKNYPEDIILNAVNLKNHFIHNLKYTDETLKCTIKNKINIQVSQGYTKCSCAIVSDNALITSDVKIHNELTNNGFDVLLIPPGDILLPGLNYGFIGGTCGLTSNNELIFYGNLKNYKYGDMIIEFLKKYNVTPIFLNEGPLVDRGSLLFLSI
ncbi:hypothetical protein C1I91_10215 [Clostridium manihotivorum]|uniref:DUF6873 domain-containing protein n=2 Tax=Clostridium manihotivorum TaxID=2320868 RepID=A0A3R5QYM2_9CLOT|nr:hypothetical protein C1I91_10215 [Clostridium manihotivorum]